MWTGEKIAGVDHVVVLALKTFQSGDNVWFKLERRM